MQSDYSADYATPALCYAANGNAEAFAAALSVRHACVRSAAPTASELEAILSTFGPGDAETARRLINMAYALCATLPGAANLCYPADAGPLLQRLYGRTENLRELCEILTQLESLRATSDAFPGGSFHLVKACDGILHYTRTGPTETADAIFNRTAHIHVEPIGQKVTEINPFGFTVTVREAGHSPNHSYYNIV